MNRMAVVGESRRIAGVRGTARAVLGALAATAIMGAPAAAAPPGPGFVPDLGGASTGAPCGGSVLCVGPGGGFASIAAAVAVAPDGATIQVKAGTYPGVVQIAGKSLTLLGGFPAGSFATRDPASNPTVINAGKAGSAVWFNGAGRSTIDGFTITGGKAVIDEYGGGGGSGVLVSDSGAVTISNNLITGNDDERNPLTCNCQPEGGGIKVERSGPAHIAGNIIRGNGSNRGAGIALFGSGVIAGNLVENNVARGDHGGGLFMTGASLRVQGNLVRNNSIGSGVGYGWGGGGLVFANPDGPAVHADLVHNRWVANSAPTIGSGVFIDESATADLLGDLVHDNACPDTGGAGIYVDGGAGASNVVVGSVVKVENVTVAGHGCGNAVNGAGLIVEGGSRADVLNSIFSGNGGRTDVLFCTQPGMPCTYEPLIGPSSIRYSLVGGKLNGVTPGPGMLMANPAFVAPGAGDYHLSAGSPAIDAADPSSPVGAEPQPNGGRRNLGAYGGTVEATISGGGPPPPGGGTQIAAGVKAKGKKDAVVGRVKTERECRAKRRVKLVKRGRVLAKRNTNAKGKFKFPLKGKLAGKLRKVGSRKLVVELNERRLSAQVVCAGATSKKVNAKLKKKKTKRR